VGRDTHLIANAKPVVLVILDGWGVAPDRSGNAVTDADTPVMDRLQAEYPFTTLKTSGLDVGLPPGQMGNSEVGHLNIGAGYVVYQEITRINRSIADGSFAQNHVLNRLIDGCVSRGGALHCLGLIGDGGVHSLTEHLLFVVSASGSRGLRHVCLHAFTDGRDTSPTSGSAFLAEVQDACQRLGTGRVATVSGRYYAMDRDKRWERTKLAYEAIVEGSGQQFTSAGAAIDYSYKTGVTDEFIVPSVIVPPGAAPVRIRPNDAVFFVNFRADRARQLTRAMADPKFNGFERRVDLSGQVDIATMTRYEDGLNVSVVFESDNVKHPLARVVSEAGMAQLHVAETEKYAHVTYFLNGGREEPFPNEQRTLIPSPKVATYDLQPEMSAPGVTGSVVSGIQSSEFDFIVVNFANCDMVGHTGNFRAAVNAVETVDASVGRIISELAKVRGTALITADHGNAEEMVDPETGIVMTSHTTNPVPCVLATPDNHPLRHASLQSGCSLSAIAPTILMLLGLSPPAEMTAPSLIVD
jgi:2,3-bisphosphoglycerate-independent phosphoglycerate mutase